MSIRMEDLPPKAREQVAAKMVRKGRIATPSCAMVRNDTGSKYHNRKAVRVMPDGAAIRFDSQKESRRFDELLALRNAGRIKDLRLQVDFTLREAYTTAEGYHVQAIRYRADFVYWERVEQLRENDGFPRRCVPCNDMENWRQVVEDVKSKATKTRAYGIKKKLMLEKYGILIREV